MARISRYDLDETLSINDYLLGNDVSASGPVATKRFSLMDLRSFFVDGLGNSIPNEVPTGFVPINAYTSVTEDGEDINKSTLRVVRTPRAAGAIIIRSADGPGIDLTVSSLGAHRLSFTNYTEIYDLEDFDGITVLISNPSLPGGSVTATFGEVVEQADGKLFRYNEAGNYIFDLELTNLSQTLTQSYPGVIFISLASTPQTFQTELYGDLDVDGQATVNTLLVEGMAEFQGPVQMDTTLNVDGNVTLNSSVNIPLDDSTDTLTTGSIRYNLDGETTVVTGATATSDISVNVESSFTEDVTLEAPDNGTAPDLLVEGGGIQLRGGTHSIRVYTDTDGMTERHPILPVIGNGTEDTPADQGLLTSIQIGDNTWHLPIATSSVAQILPGLLEELSVNSMPTYTGTFFYGLDRGSFVNYESTVAVQPAEISIPASSSFVNVSAQGQVSSADQTLNTNLLTAFSGIPTNQRLFFVASTTQGTHSFMSRNVPARITLDDAVPVATEVRVQYTGTNVFFTYTTTMAGETVIDLPTTPPAGGSLPIVQVETRIAGQTTFTVVPTTEWTFSPDVSPRTPVRPDIIDGIVFEVTNYDAIDYVVPQPGAGPTATVAGRLEFSLVGQGTIQVASDRLNITSSLILPNLPAASAADNLLWRDPITGEVGSQTLTGVVGAKAQVRYCPAGNPTDLTNLSEIHFLNASASSGIITVSSGKFQAETVNGVVGGPVSSTTNFVAGTDNVTAVIGGYTVLGEIPSNQGMNAINAICRLPAAEPGDGTRIINLSTRGANPLTNDGVWGIGASSGQLIDGLANPATSGTATDTLVLDDRTAHFDLLYVNNTIGWVIMD